MRADKYDLVVVGAGPAGLSLAGVAAEHGIECLVAEKARTIGGAVRTSGASWIKDMVNLGIPRECLNPIREVAIVGPHEEATTTFDDPVSCIIDVSALYRFLAQQAQQQGVELALGADVKDVLMQDGFISGVKMECSGEDLEIRSKAVVDASGVSASLVRRIGIMKKWTRTGVGFQYNVESSNIQQHKAFLLVGQKVAPSGYAWIFPWKGGRARIGVGIIRPDSSADPKRFADTLLQNCENRYFKANVRIVGKETGIFPCAGPIRTTVANGFLAVGDAAGQGSPLHGEGIRYAIRFGQIAGKVISDAILEHNVSKKRLTRYERVWRNQEERNFRVGLSIQRRVARYSDPHWDETIRYLRQISIKNTELLVELFRSNFSYGNLWQIFRHSPLRAMKNILRSRFTSQQHEE